MVLSEYTPDMPKLLERAFACVREVTDFVPKVGLVLGSGLGDYAEKAEIVCVVPYEKIEGFPLSTAPGHVGQFLFGYVEETPVVIMQGRVHYYEGYTPDQVVMPIRLMRMMGAEIVFLTNASGGIGRGLAAGDLVLLTDQISFFAPSPLRGPNLDSLGVRFPDMSAIYDHALRRIVKKQAAALDIDLKEGVYAQTQGPNYESPAEIAMLRTLGADCVGMSTACEAIAANHCGLRVVGISSVSNLAAGISPHPLSEEEVLEAGRQVADKFGRLVTACIGAFGREA